MSELRYNFISREWVVIATERAKRPKDFMKSAGKSAILPVHKESCPFCPGNEDRTPPELFRLPDEKAWKVRVIYNKFAALSPKEKQERVNKGLRRSMSGFGIHEVIVENPRHNSLIPQMADEEVENIILTYKNRYLSIQQDTHIEAIVIFKNHGPLAGTSLEHTHSQLIATPIVPPQLRNRMETGMHYFDDTGNCILCQTLREELQERQRIVCETKDFVSFIPYAALSPFHMWIFPRRHMSSFVRINDEEIRDLARNLKITLGKLYYGLDNPDFNYTIHSAPTDDRETEHFHWYISVIPRLTHVAGFELGSGMFINISLPEESAQFLRKVECF